MNIFGQKTKLALLKIIIFLKYIPIIGLTYLLVNKNETVENNRYLVCQFVSIIIAIVFLIALVVGSWTD